MAAYADEFFFGAAASRPLRYGFAVAHTFMRFAHFGTRSRTRRTYGAPWCAPRALRIASPWAQD
jgi:hypothetical protein